MSLRFLKEIAIIQSSISKMDISSDAWYIILDKLDSYDIVNLRASCKYIKNIINKYYFLKLNLIKYDNNTDYFKQFLLERTDMQIVIHLFKNYNIVNFLIWECLNMINYMHELNRFFGKFIKLIVDNNPKTEGDVYMILSEYINSYESGGSTILELITGGDGDIVRYTHGYDIDNIILRYICYILYDSPIGESSLYKDITQKDLTIDRELRRLYLLKS